MPRRHRNNEGVRARRERQADTPTNACGCPIWWHGEGHDECRHERKRARVTTPSEDVAKWVLARVAQMGDDRRAKEKWLDRVGLRPHIVLGSDSATDDHAQGRRSRPPRRGRNDPPPGLREREGAREKAPG